MTPAGSREAGRLRLHSEGPPPFDTMFLFCWRGSYCLLDSFGSWARLIGGAGFHSMYWLYRFHWLRSFFSSAFGGQASPSSSPCAQGGICRSRPPETALKVALASDAALYKTTRSPRCTIKKNLLFGIAASIEGLYSIVLFVPTVSILYSSCVGQTQTVFTVLRSCSALLAIEHWVEDEYAKWKTHDRARAADSQPWIRNVGKNCSKFA